MRRFRAVLLLCAVLFAAAAFLLWRNAAGAAFVARAADLDGVAARYAAFVARPVSVTPLAIPWRGGTLPGRRYDPDRASGRPVLLVPGVHAAGIDEPRLVRFARDLAAFGHPVVTAGLADLEHYTITARATDMIEDAAGWLTRTDGRPIGMMGISFAGGLSIVAAGRPSLRGHVAFVLALGGHGDLPRTLRYLATGVQADGSLRPPHDYGLAIVLLALADRVVPAGQAQPLRQAILTFLEASRLDMIDKPRAAIVFAEARSLADTLAEPARTLMAEVNARDVATLGSRLLPFLAAADTPPALSPEESPPPDAPVYLIHGSDDNVVPAIESRLLAEHLAREGVRVRLLITPLITHAEVDRASDLADVLRLVTFWSAVLRE